MKITLLILLCCAGVMAVVGVPAGWDRLAEEDEAASDSALAGVPLDVNVQSSRPCRIVVEPGPDTVMDRGGVSVLAEHHEFEGTFRYWEEASGPVLYVYDDAQNLVGRVLKPASVKLVDLID